MQKTPSIVYNLISRHLHTTRIRPARYNGTLPAPLYTGRPNMTSPRPVPTGFSPHTERNATILLPVQDKPFLNPIQEYNRDLSVAVIRQWARTREDEAKAKWDKRKAKRDQGQGKGKGKAGKLVTGGDSEQAGEKLAVEQIGESSDARYLDFPEISRARQRLKEDLPRDGDGDSRQPAYHTTSHVCSTHSSCAKHIHSCSRSPKHRD